MHASIFHANLVTAALIALVPLTAPVASAQAPDTAAEKTAELAAAAEAGDPWAMYFLAEAHRVRLRGGWPEVSFEGLLYWYKAVEQDRREALKWYRAAARAGDPDAMRLLGYAYWTGGGVDHDFAAGKRWIEQAAAAGDERAAALLESQSRYRRAPRQP